MRGHVRKHGTGWQYVVNLGKDPITGKRKTHSKGGFTKKKDCETALAKKISDIESGNYFEPQKISIVDFMKYWLESRSTKLSPSSIKRYSELIAHINAYLGSMQLSSLKPLHIQNFYNNVRVDKNLTNATVYKIHSVLATALKDAVRWQMLINAPTQYVIPPRPEKPTMEVWDADEVVLFLEKIKDNKLYIPVLLAAQTGMRLGEICGLKWENVDLVNGVINVRLSLQQIGKEIIIKQPKTKGSIRTITLMEDTIKALKVHKRKQLELKLQTGNTYDYVCGWEDGRPFVPDNVTKNFPRLIKKYNFKKIRFHDLRHTHATLLLQLKISPKVVGERLGHSIISTTMDTYSHVLPNMQHEAAEKLNHLFESTQRLGCQ